ncbi:hypothetical protein LOTGIDRAFT_108597 [Lottia gigantea]|uniref:Voltage-dependent calcium channel gamma-7 subunit n=1 Tax=Lottia gigantea TaxID=225164 RepID=V3Z0E8_LOTGI|nr:hypothetical protein LOTGIDRAFT_108597 [Lottia gigantea]ESO83933.1 hypothetical protein LOTGIDRAFT_108597 [Lottia gigantea]
MAVKCTIYRVTAFSFTLGAISLGLLALAVSTDAWLYMSTAIQISPEVRRQFNITGNIIIHMRSGLWRVCTVNVANGKLIFFNEHMEIQGIFLLQKGNIVVLSAIRVAAPLPVCALILCVISAIFHSVGSIHGDRKILFAAGFYILSGLSLAVGIVLYISAINDEVGLISKKERDHFVYYYGWSFYTAGIAFITSEMAAVVCVNLFLQKYTKLQDLEDLIPGLQLQVRFSKKNYYAGINQTLIL